MKISSLFVVIASCLLVHAYQIPVQLIEGLNPERPNAAEDQISVSDLVALLNKINSEYGTLLSAERNNVTMWSGKEHVSYRSGRLFLSNSSVVTTWQIQYPNKEQKATICAHLPSFTTRCWDSGSGYASVGGSRSARYIPSLIAGKFVVFEGDYCLVKSDNQNDLMWTYNGECLRFDLRPSHETFISPRGLTLDAAMAGIDSDMLFWEPGKAIANAVVRTVGSIVITFAPNSDAANRVREGGEHWGGCGTIQC